MAAESGTQDLDVIAESNGTPADAATPPSRATPEIWNALEREPFCFDFFQAVRLLERLMPDRQPVGLFVNPSREVVHFGAHSITSFPRASSILLPAWRVSPPRCR